jgi:hypothetical protein
MPCEDFIQKQRAEQEKHEAERYKQRLAATNLEDPAPSRDSNTIQVVVMQNKDEA